METVELAVKLRSKKGSRYARNLRRSGGVPAILYGHGMTPLSLEVNARELFRAMHTHAGENAILQLKADNVELPESTCVIKDIQHNPVTDKVAHVDFTVISLTEKIEVRIPVVVKNAENAAGVKAGGVLDIVHHEIQVICLPTEIPDAILVDVKEMAVGDAVHVKELKLPSGVEVDQNEIDLEEVVVTIHPPEQEEEAAPVEGEEATQPEVIEKGKKPAEGEEPQAGGGKAQKS